MSAELVMAGPGQPVTHASHHDLESIFYVLLGICVLLDAPGKFKSDKELSRCFDKYFNTFEPSILKTITIQSDLTWLPMIVAHVSPYFQPLIPLLARLRSDLILPMYTDEKGSFRRKNLLTHEVLIDSIIDALLALSDDAWKPHRVSGTEHDDHVKPGDETSDSGESEQGSEEGYEERSQVDEEAVTSSPAATPGDSELQSPTSPSIPGNIFRASVDRLPLLPRLTACRASGSVGFPSVDTYLEEVRRQECDDDEPDQHRQSRAKRVRSSPQDIGLTDQGTSSLPPGMRKGRSTGTVLLRRSTRASKKSDYIFR